MGAYAEKAHSSSAAPDLAGGTDGCYGLWGRQKQLSGATRHTSVGG